MVQHEHEKECGRSPSALPEEIPGYNEQQPPTAGNRERPGSAVLGSRADQAYVSDITYIWTQEGWLYLTVFVDLFSRRVVGWSMSSRMKAKSVTGALRMTLRCRRPAAGLIVHSDRGSQYASEVYRRLLKAHDFVGSMSRKGDCWDNAVAESVFASLKKERVQWKHYQTRAAAQQDILDCIAMFYNSRRLHSILDYSSPNDFASAMAEMKEAA